MTSDLKFYLHRGMRHLPMMIVIFGLMSAVGIAMALFLPPSYSASARLIVESPQIPDDLASTTVSSKTAEQLQVIQQQLLTRGNLIDLARKHQVYEAMNEMTPDQIVTRMRSDVTFRTAAGRDQATMVTVGFDGRTGQIVANVTNDLVTSILDANVRMRTNVAGDTLAFFQQEVERLGLELDRQSAKIIDFQNQNLNALPDGQAFRLSRQTALQERLTQMRRDIQTLDAQKETLLTLYQSTGGVANSAQPSPLERQIEEVRSNLIRARSVFAPGNPRVVALESQLQRLEAERNQQAAASTPQPDQAAPAEEGVSTSTGSPALDAQLAELANRRQLMEEQVPQIERELATLQVSIDSTPANSVTLDALRRDYQNIQLQYNTARSNMAQATTGERIELASKGQRITVIEQATVPSEPAAPNRKKLAAMGIAAGMGAALAFAVVMEMLNRSVSRPSDLVRALDITPLATIPYLQTTAETARRTWGRSVAALAVIALIVAGLWVIDTRYMPLDLVVAALRQRIGL